MKKITRKQALFWTWKLWQVLSTEDFSKSRGKIHSKRIAINTLKSRYKCLKAKSLEDKIFGQFLCPCCAYTGTSYSGAIACRECPMSPLWGTDCESRRYSRSQSPYVYWKSIGYDSKVWAKVIADEAHRLWRIEVEKTKLKKLWNERQ